MVSDTAFCPGTSACAGGADRTCSTPHAHRRERPGRLQLLAEELVGSLGRVDAARSCSRCTSPADTRPPTTWSSPRPRPPRPAVPVLPARPARLPARRARRCLAAGARGIKFHPRAEDFNLDHPDAPGRVRPRRGERLPILCHAGRGIPALGRHSIEVCARHPNLRLILAHAGISDLAWIWREAPAHPNLFFDTAWWSPSDIQALFALVPPGQILMASDAPYGTPAFAATMAMRHGLQVGLSPDALRGVLGAQARRLAEREPPLDLGPPPGDASLSRDPLMERVYSFLLSAIGQMFAGVDPKETLALAALACHVREGDPHAPIYEAILALLDARESYDPTGDGRPPPLRARPALHRRRGSAGPDPRRACPGRGARFFPRAPGSDPKRVARS